MENNFNKHKSEIIQTEIDFDTPELVRVISELNSMYPIIKETIKDRITYDGNYFIMNNNKYSEEKLKVLMGRLNEIKTQELQNKNDDEDYEYTWQKIFNE